MDILRQGRFENETGAVAVALIRASIYVVVPDYSPIFWLSHLRPGGGM